MCALKTNQPNMLQKRFLGIADTWVAHASNGLNMHGKDQIRTRKLSCTCYLYTRKRKLFQNKLYVNGDNYLRVAVRKSQTITTSLLLSKRLRKQRTTQVKYKKEFIFKGLEFKYKRKHLKIQNLNKCIVKRKIRASVMHDESP